MGCKDCQVHKCGKGSRYKHDVYTYEEVRPMFEAAIRDRGRLFGFFYKVMPKDLFDKYAKEAWYEYGRFKSKMGTLYKGENGDVEEFADFMISEANFGVAGTSDGEAWRIERGTDRSVVAFGGKCQLVAAWEQMGLSEEEVMYLCEVACYGDAGYTEELDLKGYFNFTSADPKHDYCEFVIEKKK